MENNGQPESIGQENSTDSEKEKSVVELLKEELEKAKLGRPDIRKVVGEAVVLNVKERTATIVITRTAQEIHTGDWVEIQ